MSPPPPSYWPAPDSAWSLCPNLVALIDKTLAAPLPPNISKLDRHNALQERLRLLGEELEFVPTIEVATGYRKFKASGRFDVVWEPKDGSAKIIFEIDSCWRHESLLKLGRVGADALKLWIYYGQRPFPNKPDEPGFRRLNILKIQPHRLGVKDGRRVVDLAPGSWPEALYPRRASTDVPLRFGRQK